MFIGDKSIILSLINNYVAYVHSISYSKSSLSFHRQGNSLSIGGAEDLYMTYQRIKY